MEKNAETRYLRDTSNSKSRKKVKRMTSKINRAKVKKEIKSNE